MECGNTEQGNDTVKSPFAFALLHHHSRNASQPIRPGPQSNQLINIPTVSDSNGTYLIKGFHWIYLEAIPKKLRKHDKHPGPECFPECW